MHRFIWVAIILTGVAHADPYYVGPKACTECHKAEGAVWEATKHATSFKDVHKNEKAKAILAAAGGDANMRKNATCTQCHFTMEQADASAAPLAKSSVSCEKCHGPGSDFIKIHNDFGGPDVKREAEAPAHKTKRLADARAAGMFLPDSLYDIAANCMACHGLAKPGLDTGILAKMLEAGHPFDPDYELVRYSQGTVRHRFYPPDTDKNKEQTPAELSRMFVIGQAAKLVSAAGAKSDNAAYSAAQAKRVADATAALKNVPDAAALIAAPTADNARKLAAAIAGKDLTKEVGSLLPAKDSYK